MLTGGVGLENVGQPVVQAAAVAFGGGGNLTAGAETGDYESISKVARELVGKVKEVRGK